MISPLTCATARNWEEIIVLREYNAHVARTSEFKTVRLRRIISAYLQIASIRRARCDRKFNLIIIFFALAFFISTILG